MGLGVRPVTHAQAVDADCVFSRVFYNKNKAFQHIVPTLSYAQVLAKGLNPTFKVPLDKPCQHIIPPLSHAKVKAKGPNSISSCKSSGVTKPSDHKTSHVENTLSGPRWQSGNTLASHL